jgi:alpha 1,3-mannosyltransferase
MIDSYLPQYSAPLKEGRSHPSSPACNGKARRKGLALRTIFVFAVVTTWLITSHVFSWDCSSVPDAERVRTCFSKAKDRIGRIQHPYVKTAEPLSEDKDAQQSSPDISSKDNKNSDARPTFPDGFDAALDHLSSIIPNEIYLRELLRPIMGTGPEKLRELGLRTRAYKQFFEAWEKLHLVTEHDDNIYYVRDDLVSYIRAKFSKETFSETLRKYESYRYFLTKLSALLFPWTSPYFADHMSLHASSYHGGRGIVFTAGDNHAPFLLTAIPSLRTLGCELPIEIMYLGDSDLSEDSRAALEALSGVSTRDLSAMVNDEGWRLAGWAGKPFSILFSSFREVIFIDADSLFFVNPEVLFDDEDYVRTGALFFKDRMIMPESKKQWLQQVVPKPISKLVLQSRMWTGESGHMQESGVVVVDKWRHFVALLLVSRMNGPDRDGDKKAGIVGIYDMVYGLSSLTSPVFVS